MSDHRTSHFRGGRAFRPSPLLAGLLAAAAGALFCLLLLLLFTAITVDREDPSAGLRVLSILAWMLGAAATGITAGLLRRGDRPTAAALLGALFLLLLILLLSLIFREGRLLPSPWLFLLQIIGIPGIALLAVLPLRASGMDAFRSRRRISSARRRYR